MAQQSIMAVFAHPDDEALSAGGLLAGRSAQGGRVEVVTTTWSPGTVRARELAIALAELGAGSPRMLGFADHRRAEESAPGRPRLCDARLDDVVELLVAQIRAFQPDLVVTHDHLGGLTGHPDHIQTYRATVIATEASGWEQLHPDAGAAWAPESLWLATHPNSVVPAVREIIGARKAVNSIPDSLLSEAVDVRAHLTSKLAAIRAHRSEAERGSLPGVVGKLSAESQQKLLGTEWYMVRQFAKSA